MIGQAACAFVLAAAVFSPTPQRNPSALPLQQRPQTLREARPMRSRAGPVTVPFEYFKRHIYVAVRVNGMPGFIFMLDSGANRNILNLRTARQLGMTPVDVTREKNVGLADGRIDVAREEPVRAAVGPAAIADAMAVVDLSSFERRFGHPTDGLLGAPFWQQFVVKVDFKKRLLSLYPAERYAYHGSGIDVPLRESRQGMVIPVTLGATKYDSQTTAMEVDTGSNVSLSLYRHCVHRLHLEQSVLHARTGEGYGVNGEFASTQGLVDFLWIGNVEASDLPVDYFEPSQPIHPRCDVAGSIGNGILQNFQSVIFDVPHRRIVFELDRPAMQLRAMWNGHLLP